ncbi:MAG: aspartate-semialdehyde dehydrogenase [Halobacteriovoraceae bacterium]|nr:aspartate-semialdehyde dehydrogenase [Halobacteriovoraceae bacterium]
MAKLKLGMIGWRGMVGSVLVERMKEEGDFECVDSYFFSTSQVGEKAPELSVSETLKDAHSLEDLSEMDIILTCQGGDYTNSIHPQLREKSWSGIWIDAASALRMKDNACLVLDPLNSDLIKEEIKKGTKDFIGANCTVSLMLLALAGPLRAGEIEWISSMTYQAASGAGAKNMKELVNQMGRLHQVGKELSEDGRSDILKLDALINDSLQGRDSQFPTENFKAPLAGSLIPWIDVPVEGGQTKEEWKAGVEGNKILGNSETSLIPIDGTCVRIGAMRSHSQALTIKLKKPLDLEKFEKQIKESHEWVDFVPNEREITTQKLSPAHYSGSLKIGVGRVRPMNLGKDFVNVFTVGDQLLWGAAEPLRRFLRLYLDNI